MSELQAHLERARELNVSLSEYAEAYSVDLDDLKAASRESLLSDFVAVKVEPSSAATSPVACRLVHPCGTRLEFEAVPPVEFLASLWRALS